MRPALFQRWRACISIACARSRCLAAGVALLGALNCSGHEARVATALSALNRGNERAAIAALNEEMEVSSENDLPKMSGDNALLLLDRGSILLSTRQHSLAARDLGAADKAIEVLDLSRNKVADLGKYLFSDDAGPYKAPAHEKLLINTVNILNYLAMKDLSGARVEARRLAIMQRYLSDAGESDALCGLGSYLAGFAFEKSGSPDEAVAHYDDALKYSHYASLTEALRRIPGARERSPRIRDILGEDSPTEDEPSADILVVVGSGRVPPKEPVRVPIGLALTLVANDLSPRDRNQAGALAAKGLVTWVNYPKLGSSLGLYSVPTMAVDGRPISFEDGLDVEAEVRSNWDEKQSIVVASAITRMIARVVAGEAAQAATEAATGRSNPLGLLLGLATSATLSAADTPDTRSWVTLPARFSIARIRVAPGEHQITTRVRGRVFEDRVTVTAGDWIVLPRIALR